MKKLFLIFLLMFINLGLFAEEELKGQVFPFNEKANEEIIIINKSFCNDAFKIYVHTKSGHSFRFNGFYANYASTEEGWKFLTKTPEIKNNDKWKSPSDFEILELSLDLHKSKEDVITTEYEDKFRALGQVIYFIKVKER